MTCNDCDEAGGHIVPSLSLTDKHYWHMHKIRLKSSEAYSVFSLTIKSCFFFLFSSIQPDLSGSVLLASLTTVSLILWLFLLFKNVVISTSCF